jgi:hypothetical protein
MKKRMPGYGGTNAGIGGGGVCFTVRQAKKWRTAYIVTSMVRGTWVVSGLGITRP